MNERHLEQPDPLNKTVAELTEAVTNLATEQELRDIALDLAIKVYQKPDSNIRPDEIIDLAAGFYGFLSSDGSDD